MSSSPNLVFIKTMIELQNKMNEKVDHQWIVRGWNWRRAIWLETAEAVEHLPWKWWKHTPAQGEQSKMELVDIWHFILSLAIETDTTDELVDHYKEQNPVAEEIISSELMASLELLVVLALQGNNTTQLYSQFNQCLADAGLTLTELYRMYVGKNVLNMFRQDNGYKDGTYIKMWHGVEDNKVLALITAQLDPLTTDDYANDVYVALTNAYQEVKNATV